MDRQDSDFLHFIIDYNILVKDNGLGMTSEQLDKLFINFKCKAGLSNPTGTGLGLGICMRLINKMGGYVRVKSEVGRGSTFKIRLRSLSRIRKNANKNIETEGKTISMDQIQSFWDDQDQDVIKPCQIKDKPSFINLTRCADDFINVLVVNDDPGQLMILRHMLVSSMKHLSHNIDVAHNGIEALQMVKQVEYAVIVTDLNMPQMDGYRFSYETKK